MTNARKEQSAHPKRVPVSSSRAPLKVNGFDQTNQVGRWVNDIDDRIIRFLEGGYQFVNQDGSLSVGEGGSAGSASSVDSRVKKPVGKGVTAYLMAIPREFYEADQAAKQREVDATEEAMKRPGKGSISKEVDYGTVNVQSKFGK